jgi:serine/threonine-protein kinase HipA
MAREGKVYVQDQFAGLIRETDRGYEFLYDQAYLSKENALPVSLTLPLREEVYVSNTLFPFFDGLIPEGWLLDVVERNWKVDGRDRFGLMLVACRDCIGDVRIEVTQ